MKILYVGNQPDPEDRAKLKISDKASAMTPDTILLIARAKKQLKDCVNWDQWVGVEQLARCIGGVVQAHKNPDPNPRIAERMQAACEATLKNVLDNLS